MLQNANRKFAVMLMALAPLLSGCPGPLKRPCEPQAIPTKPALSQPLPEQSYSSSAQATIESWQKSLTDMRQMSKP